MYLLIKRKCIKVDIIYDARTALLPIVTNSCGLTLDSSHYGNDQREKVLRTIMGTHYRLI